MDIRGSSLSEIVPSTAGLNTGGSAVSAEAAVQRLFAVGLDLHLALELVTHPQVALLLGHAVEELDSSINAIRVLLFDSWSEALSRSEGMAAEHGSAGSD